MLFGFFCYGKEIYVGEFFVGLNGSYMVLLIIVELELNIDFCDIVEGEVSFLLINLF